MDFSVPDKIKGKSILIVEDQSAIRSLISTYFRGLGFTRVDVAMDGEAAADHLRKNAVDIVVSDWEMSKSTGLDLLKEVRGSEPTKTLSFLMMSSAAELSKVKVAVDLGVSDFLIKPFQSAQLGYKVTMLLNASTHKARKMRVTSVKPLDSSDDDDDQFVPAINSLV